MVEANASTQAPKLSFPFSLGADTSITRPTACPLPGLEGCASGTRQSGQSSPPPVPEARCATAEKQTPDILGVCEELVESVFIVLETHHRHQEALDHLPRLPPVVGLRVGALQAVQRGFDGLR